MNDSYSALIKRLQHFIKSYYTNMIIRGLFSCIAILTLLFIVFCAIEYFSFLNNSFRKILFWTYLSVGLVLLLKFVFFPIIQLLQLTKKRLSKKEAAKIIGSHFSEIEDKLINILELNDSGSTFSSEIIFASIEKKYKKIQPFQFKSAIDWKTTFKYLKLSFVPFGLLLIIFLAGYAEMISHGTNRIIQYDDDFSPPPPFTFIVKSDLQTLEKKDFVLKIETTGKRIPKHVFIKYNGESYRAEQAQENVFTYTFRSPQKEIDFEIFSEEIWSELMRLKILPIPLITDMEVVIRPPKYTKVEIKKIQDLGFLQVPDGSVVSWSFSSKNTDQMSFLINNISTVLNMENNHGSIQKKILESTEYSISVANKFEGFKDSIHYFIDVIDDEFPTISVEEIIDSADVKKRFIKGVINDDYGFSSLVLSINTNDTTINEKLNIDLENSSQVFFKTIDFEKFSIEKETDISFIFTVYDNDLVNGYKYSKTKLFNITQPSTEELIEQYNEERDLVEDGIKEQLASLKKLEEELERLEKNLIENEDIDWKDKLSIEETLKKYNEIKKELEQLKHQLTKNREGREKTQNLNESILKKQKEIEELFDQIMPQEMKDLLEEIERSLEDLDKSNLQESLKKLQLSNEDVEKELDRNLKLLKQLEFDQKLETAITKLDELAKKEKNLSQKSLNKTSNKEDLYKAQKENLEDFQKLKEQLEELNSLDKELGGKHQLNTKNEQDEIENTMQNSLNEIEKKNKKRASKSQELSSKQIESLSKNLKKSRKEKSTEKQIESIETLRQILENLVYFSKSEEDLMLEFSKLYNDDPKYIQLMHKQGDLRNDAKIIEDSLFALSQRIPQISATINREINAIQQKTESAINHFRERETLKGTSKQQYVMTSANNLAVLLSNILEQLQKDLSSDLPSSQECEKPGNGQPKPGDLQKMQKELAEHLKEMEKKMKEGKGDSGFSKKLAEMLARQEQIRMTLQEIQKSLENPGDQMKLKDVLDKMEKTEEDIANKKISQETILRQDEIETRLLELESALREQEESKERESKEGINYEKIKNDVSLKHELEKKEQIELLKTTPPSLTNYFKKRVNIYFNLLLNNPDL